MSPLGKLFDQRSKYNSLALIVLGGLVASVLIGMFLIRPSWNNLKVLGKEIPVEQTKRDQAQMDAKNLESAKKFFASKQEAVETVNTAVPIQPSVPAILVILEDLARQNNVFLTSFSPQQVGGTSSGTSGGASSGGASGGSASGSAGAGSAGGGAESGASSIEITANYKGQYSSLINFFYSLERSLRIVDVKTLNVNTTDGGAIEGNITFRAYYKPVSGESPASGGTGASGGSAPGGAGASGGAGVPAPGGGK